MKKFFVCFMAAATLFMMTGCESMSTTGKGTAIGAGGGAAAGALLGMILSSKNDRGKGAAIGAAIGTAVGAGTGAVIGNHMQKKQEQLAREMAEQAKVESYTDANGLAGIKVTFDADMTFAKNSSSLNANAQAAVKKFAAAMKEADVANAGIVIKGHTDSSGGDAINQPLSEKRAAAVGNILRSNGIATDRIAEQGMASSEPITGNAADAANRRVEVYVIATDAMVQQYSN